MNFFRDLQSEIRTNWKEKIDGCVTENKTLKYVGWLVGLDFSEEKRGPSGIRTQI